MEMTRDGGKIYFDWWNTFQPSEKLPNIYLVR